MRGPRSGILFDQLLEDLDRLHQLRLRRLGAHENRHLLPGLKLMINKGQKVQGARVLVLGITFKESCTDIRNSALRPE